MNWKDNFINKYAARPIAIDRELLLKITNKIVNEFINELPKKFSNLDLNSIQYDENYTVEFSGKRSYFFTDVLKNIINEINIHVSIENLNKKSYITGGDCDFKENEYGHKIIQINIGFNGKKTVKDFIENKNDVIEQFYQVLSHEYNHFMGADYQEPVKYYNPSGDYSREKYYKDWTEIRAFMQTAAALIDRIINKMQTENKLDLADIKNTGKMILKKVFDDPFIKFEKSMSYMPKHQRDTFLKGIWTFIMDELTKKSKENTPA